VALRNRAHESLVQATGRDLPADAKTWDELLHRPDGDDALATEEKKGALQPAAWWKK
jgi:hypothetical protein